MNRSLIQGIAVGAISFCGLTFAMAQDQGGIARTKANAEVRNTLVKASPGNVIVPESSVHPAHNGTTLKTRLASTSLLIYEPEGWNRSEVEPPRPGELPPYGGYAYETPASLACVYGLVTTATGCNPNSVTTNPTGGSKVIAIVDAFDDPWAGPDLAYFSAQFGIPFTPSQFQVVYQTPGTEPPIDESGSWEVEESLDIEYSHAMAPDATIYLVEAESNSYANLLASVEIASDLVRCGQTTTCPAGSKGTGEVSMSWGGGEFSDETKYDSIFTTPGVVYFASAGDSPGTLWPCVSPNVVCAGGTTFRRSPETGNFIQETDWTLGGGGISLYETIPGYQKPIKGIVGPARGVPDVSADSNPVTGLWVWDSNYFEADGGGWFIVGGTSAASPTLAGIVNRAGSFYASSAKELTEVYSNMTSATDYFDVTEGICGPYAGYLATTGWDPCTGVGSPVGYGGK